MTEPSFLETPQGRRIAYHATPGSSPGIVFLGGFMSDMEGTKAVHLEAWCKAQGRAFLRFDYSGHGQSSERFEDGCIGDWAADAEAAVTALTDGPQLLIGSSMGGWISLLMAKRLPEKVAALVTIAAAPDFTEDGYWAKFTPEERATLEREGQTKVPSDYDAPYTITRRLIEDGRENLVLREPLPLAIPTRFLQGTEDTDVPMERATTLLAHVTGPDIRLVALKGADHSFSSPEALKLIEDATNNALDAIEA
ncbi:MAG: alpha/beta hydrolase [Pseudomonadota bacterium]